MSLNDDIDFSDVLNACKQQSEHNFSTVSVFPFACWAACQESESKHLGAPKNEGFVHYCSSNLIRQGCLKHVLLEKPLKDTGKIIQAAFEVIRPGLCNAYTEHPIIKNILKRPLDILAYSKVKKLQNDIRGYSTQIFQINTSKTSAWDDKLHGFSAS